jgi:hypothetical protein
LSDLIGGVHVLWDVVAMGIIFTISADKSR